MSAKTDAEVIIDGKVFTIVGYESEEYLQKVASYINNKYAEYKKADSFRRLTLPMIILRQKSRLLFLKMN